MHEGWREARDSGLNPLDQMLTVPQRLQFHEGCGNCHNNIHGQGQRPTLDSAVAVSGWMLAPLPMQWVGKDDEELCRLVKRHERDGNQFIDHVERDHGEVQFIEVAYNGDRALGFDYDRTPPPGSAAQLTAQARRWVELMGAESGWVGDPNCGCAMPGIKLRIRHRSEIDPGHPHFRAGFLGFSGDATFEVTLHPDPRMEAYRRSGQASPDMELYRGTVSLVRPLRVYHANRNCRGTASQREDWEFNTVVDQKTTDMTLQFGFYPSEETGSSTCTIGGHVTTMEIYPDLNTDLNRITVPLESGAVREETLSGVRGRAQEWLEVTVLDAGPPAAP